MARRPILGLTILGQGDGAKQRLLDLGVQCEESVLMERRGGVVWWVIAVQGEWSQEATWQVAKWLVEQGVNLTKVHVNERDGFRAVGFRAVDWHKAETAEEFWAESKYWLWTGDVLGGER